MAWTGCYEIKFTKECPNYEPGLYGAFVNVVVNCQSESRFREKAAQSLLSNSFEILEVTEVAEFELENSGLSADETRWIGEQLDAGETVSFGYFHTYPEDGLDS